MKLIPKNTLVKFITAFVLVYNAKGLLFTRQDMLRVNLCRLDKFNVIGKNDCCKVINKWKLENKEDREYRILLDEGMRQICNDNIFPLFVNKTNEEYIIINLVSDNNVNVLNILGKKNNMLPVDNCLLEYHTYLIANDYNPNYYELKTNNPKQFLTVLYMNLLDVDENKLIKLKYNDYMEYLEQDTRNKRRNKNNIKRIS